MLLAKKPQLVNERADRFNPRYGVGVGGHHFQRRVRSPVGDGPDVCLHLTEVIQIIIPLYHIARRVKGVCRHLYSRGDDGVPGSLTPVEQQGRHHYPGGQCRLGVFFGDQYKHFCNVSAAGFGII